MAVAIEVLLHRGVPRQVQHPARAAERIDTVTGKNEAGVAERLVQDGEVAARGGDAVAQVLRWSCAELDLAAWLQGQKAGRGQYARFLDVIKNFTNPLKWHGQRRISGVADQPFELGADDSRWAGFEADCPNQPFGVCLGYR